MINFFKKSFIPDSNNDHQPHALRDGVIDFLFGTALIIEIIYLGNGFIVLPRSEMLASVLSAVVVDDTNANRIENSYSPLKVSPLLQAAAQEKANDMASKGYFAHNSPDGKTPWYWIKKTGYTYSYAGENLAVNFFDSKDVVDAWMNSPEHRANILNNHFTEIGIATADGQYQGVQTIFVVEEFGNPIVASTTTRSKAVALAVTKTTSNTPTTTATTTAVTTTSKSQVKGESTEDTQIVVNDMSAYQPVIDVNTEVVHPTSDSQNSASVSDANNSVVTNAVANPRQTANLLYFLFAAFVCVAIVITLIFRQRPHHPRMIYTGLLFIVVLITIAVFNSHLATFFGSII